jgi:hypothetical protein
MGTEELMAQTGQRDTRTPGYHAAGAEPLETAGVVRLVVSSGVVDFAILLDVEEAIDLHVAIAHAARAVSEAQA